MGAYILRRLLLIIPTLIGIMLINFALTQFVPGGPIEQIAAQMQGEGDVVPQHLGRRRRSGAGRPDRYEGARGLPPEFIAELEERVRFRQAAARAVFAHDVELLRFDFGESYFRSISVLIW